MRTIREEPKYREQLEGLALDHRRIDEVMRGVLFTMANAPEHFEKVPGTSISIAKTDAYPNAPEVRIFFMYNPYEVFLLCIEFSDDEFFTVR